MLFIPQKKSKKIINDLLEEGKDIRRKRSIEDRKRYLKAKKEGKLDEYYEYCRSRWICD